jgi:hypothetical protein
MREKSTIRATGEVRQLTRCRSVQAAESVNEGTRVTFDAGIDPLC